VELQQDNRDPQVLLAQITVTLQFRIVSGDLPGIFVGYRPILTKNIPANLSAIAQFTQPFLYANPDIAAHAARTITMNQFDHRVALLSGHGDFPIEFGDRFINQRHALFEIEDLDGPGGARRLSRRFHSHVPDAPQVWRGLQKLELPLVSLLHPDMGYVAVTNLIARHDFVVGGQRGAFIQGNYFDVV